MLANTRSVLEDERRIAGAVVAPVPPAAPADVVPPTWKVPTWDRATVLSMAIEAVALAVLVLVVAARPLLGFAYVTGLALTLSTVRPARPAIRLSALRDLPSVVRCAGGCAVVLAPLVPLTHAPVTMAWMPLVSVASVFAVRCVVYAALRLLRRRGTLVDSTLVVGPPSVVRQLSQLMREHPECGLAPVQRTLIDLTASPAPGRRAADASVALQLLNPARLIVDSAWLSAGELTALASAASSRRTQVYVISRDGGHVGPRAAGFDELWGVLLRRPASADLPVTWLFKRPMEFCLAAAALLFLLPVLAMSAVAVKLSSRGPILFRQPRVGQNGRLFDVLKFRTYPVDHVDDKWSPTNGDCPLWVGRLLRRSSLDELPQLWNVIRGDMSLVGPRPERPHFVAPLHGSVEGYEARHRLPMGLTGLAQVNGLWGQTSIDDRVRFDNQYIDTWSLWGDVVILLRTVPELVRRVVSS